jgi:pSer/pThr/pTyr-binding forkhead associated (FHA) protein
VSRRHAQIVSSEDGMTIEDLGSTNGTELNGEALQQGSPKKIEAGDKVSFGGVEVVLSMPGTAGATQVVPSNKTVSTEAPKLEPAAAFLVGENYRLPLKKGVNTFGRKSENDAQIVDPYVSGKHGAIEIADDGVYLTDTGSTNGTLINDAKLAPNQRTKISADDEIRLGGIVLKVERN